MNSRLYDTVATRILAIAILGFIASLIFRQSLLGSTSIIKLNRGSYLSGAVSQSLASTSSAAKIGINYSITNQEFFDNNLYSVVLVRPLNHSSFAGVIVFKKLDGLYSPVLGPGTAINVNYLISLPKDLTQYLINSGYTYEPTY
jgi:hypothetical protein